MTVVMKYYDAFLGLTVPEWVAIILGLICVCLGMYLYSMMQNLGPTMGYLKAKSEKKANVAIVIQNHDITIKALDYFAGVFQSIGLTWKQRKVENHNFGVMNAEIVADYWGLTLNPKLNQATKLFIEMWNDPDYNDEIFPKSKDRQNALIYDADSLYDALERMPSDFEIRSRAFFYVPLYELKNYYPKNFGAADLTGYIEAMRKVHEEKRFSPQDNWMPMICFIVGLAAGVAIMMFTS